MLSPEKVWELALGQLQLQMTQATFDSWVKGTHLVSTDNGTWQIGVKSAFARDWLENRLLSTISRTVSSIAGSPVQLEFVVTDDSGSTTGLQQQRLLTGQMADILNFDVYTVGYTNHAHYIQQFWGAYLGAEALQVWSYIRSFYTEPRYIYDRKEKTYIPNPSWSPWTPPRAFRAVELARAIKSRDGREGNRKKITGAWRSCHRFKAAFDQGDVKDHCFCGLHMGQIHRAKSSPEYPEGRLTCRYWRSGILEQFQNEGIALIERTGDVLKPRTIFYNIQIYQLLPLLTPAQVNQLHEVTQIQHKQYLRAHGIEVKVWETIEAKGLMPQVVCWRGAELEPPMSLLGTKS